MKEKTAIIGGTGFLESPLMEKASKETVETRYGRVTIFNAGRFWFVQRHYGNVPPHAINYRGYIEALAGKGVKKIISVTSVGLSKEGHTTRHCRHS